jgi:hypothetical protein
MIGIAAKRESNLFFFQVPAGLEAAFPAARRLSRKSTRRLSDHDSHSRETEFVSLSKQRE